VSGTPIVRASTLKYLGVLLDPELNFSAHIRKVSLSAKRAIGALYGTVGKWAGPGVFEKLYYGTVLPALLHGFPLIAPRYQEEWQILERIHRFAARLATNNYSLPYQQLLDNLSWKPFAQICVERQLSTVYKWVNLSRYLPEELWEHKPPPRYRIRGHHPQQIELKGKLFQDQRVPIRTGATQMPIHFAFAAWNSLPGDILELSRARFMTEIHKAETFRALEATQQRSTFRNPTLLKFYENIF